MIELSGAVVKLLVVELNVLLWLLVLLCKIL